VARQVEHQAADGVDVLGVIAWIEIRADQSADVAEFGTGIGDLGVDTDLADQ
jgi:hypothetical protein